MQGSPKFMRAMQAYDEEKIEEALQLMEECAKDGDPVACFTSALWARERGALNRSSNWLERLEEIATSGDPEAQWELGQHYRFGNLFPMDIDKANHWLEAAASSGSGAAQHHLAWYLQTGQYGYSIDMERASAWFQRALAQEYPETLYVYALRLFENGQPTNEAVRLLRKAADKGCQVADEVLRAHLH